MLKRQLLLVLFCLGTGSAAAFSQDRIDPPARYAPAVKTLESFIADEVRDKHLPALSIALVDDQTIVWAAGFGFRDPAAKTPATATTVYRVGSLSSVFTDLAVMRLVEQGALSLDEPVTTYLPDFRPRNSFGTPITLRHLMAHPSGLVREPPVGHSFEASTASLGDAVASLNGTDVVLRPGGQTKCSNAAIGVVGYVLEKTQKQPFALNVQRHVLDPLGLRRSAFALTPDLSNDLARGLMWTYHGREFPAPTFDIAVAPAGKMYSTVTDLGRFLEMLFAGGRVGSEQFVKPETLKQMLAPQFAEPNATSGLGIGFFIHDLEGHRRVGHSGAVYGFATELAALPDEKLGAVVVTSRDSANAVISHVADEALREMLAVRRGGPPPNIERTFPVTPELAIRLAGRHRLGDSYLDLSVCNGRLFALASGGFRSELRACSDGLLADDCLTHGMRFKVEGDKLRDSKTLSERVAVPRPAPPPAKWLGLIGEYGWDHNTLYILEREGRLNALIEWFYLDPLIEESPDVYRFPDHSLYRDERLVFTRDSSGRASKVVAAGITFNRRHIDGEDGKTFRIHPERPIEVLRKEALAAQPPAPRGEFNSPDFVDLTTLDPTIRLDIRYATANNFLGTPLYTSARAFLQRPAAEAVVRAHRELGRLGYGLLLHDGYRPWYITKIFWDAAPAKDHIFVADPAVGSRHNRGCAVDLTLYDRATGQAVPMVGGYDEFSDRSYPDYMGGSSRQRWHRDLLRRTMEAQGFAVFEAEWWHFDYRDWKKYPTSNQTFEEIDKHRAK